MSEKVKIEEDYRLLCPQPVLNYTQNNYNSGQYYLFSYSAYLRSMAEMASRLASQLSQKNEVRSQYMSYPLPQASKIENSGNSTQDHSSQSAKNEPEVTFPTPPCSSKPKPKKAPKNIRRIKASDEQSYQPEVEVYDGTYRPPVESKNIPKSYGKAIFYFIETQPAYVASLLKHFNVPEQQFAESYQQLKGTINSIHEMRSLWVGSQSNKLAKIYRIISMEYLRKHSLGYIYNSRVSKHHKHIKYRHIIMRNMEHPEQFTMMKEF